MRRFKSNISKLFLVCVCVCVWLISDGKAPPMAGQVNAATLSPSQVALGKVIDIGGHKFVKTGSDPAKGSQFTALTDFASVAKPPLQWQRGWGGSGRDMADDQVVTVDGGVIVAGRSNSTDIPGLTNHGGTDIVLLKYDREGTLVWQQSWGGSGDDFVLDATATVDGGVVIAGNSNSTDIPGLTNYGGADAILVKFDGEGQPLWQQSWGGSGGDVARIAVITADGGVIVAGGGSVVKFDSAGELVWEQDGLNADLVITDDGGIISVANSELMKYDSAGELVWGQSMEESLGHGAELSGLGALGQVRILDVTNDGGVVVLSGETGLVKYDREGQVVWRQSDDPTTPSTLLGMSVIETLDSGLIATSAYLEYDTNTGNIILEEGLIDKYDDNGQLIWQQNLENSGGGGMILGQLPTADGGIIVASADVDVFLTMDSWFALTSTAITKYNSDGQIAWRHEWGGAGEGGFFDLQATEGSGIYAVGQFSSTEIEGLTNQGGFDIAVVKYGW